MEERQRREELQAQLLKVAENNRNLARHNTRLLQTADRLKTEGELVLHELHTRTAAFKACEAESARELGRLQRALDGCAEEMRELNTQLQAKQACGASEPSCRQSGHVVHQNPACLLCPLTCTACEEGHPALVLPGLAC